MLSHMQWRKDRHSKRTPLFLLNLAGTQRIDQIKQIKQSPSSRTHNLLHVLERPCTLLNVLRTMAVPSMARRAANTISRQQPGFQLDNLSAGPGGALAPPHGEAKLVGDIRFLVSQSGSARTSRLRLLSVFTLWLGNAAG